MARSRFINLHSPSSEEMKTLQERAAANPGGSLDKFLRQGKPAAPANSSKPEAKSK